MKLSEVITVIQDFIDRKGDLELYRCTINTVTTKVAVEGVNRVAITINGSGTVTINLMD